ncbi:hypothetical protein DBT_0461 [Dissulfuribacter thermophilus]|uniref:Uncharacterized protein n=1 Tax=Dissulfuribacter thermophilus TaxID=1156395 RepID=A0A1B9F7T1_9BACT|nr:hypothetical protein DBT_0461 [Dissulfuribacter thermophilus]
MLSQTVPRWNKARFDPFRPIGFPLTLAIKGPTPPTFDGVKGALSALNWGR